MATGAEKTFTAATLCYRPLVQPGAHRILFLVDRNNLGKHTLKESQTCCPAQQGCSPSFTTSSGWDKRGWTGANQVVISTVQRVFAALTGAELSEEDEERSELEHAHAPSRAVAYNTALPPESFDFIIVDECRRSIYESWRQVLDRFDARIIGLTATPSPATLGAFNRNLVAEYPYERSVADGVNVPFEIHCIRTQIGEHGGHVRAGPPYRHASSRCASGSSRWQSASEAGSPCASALRTRRIVFAAASGAPGALRSAAKMCPHS